MSEPQKDPATAILGNAPSSVGDATQANTFDATAEQSSGTPRMRLMVAERQIAELKAFAARHPELGIDLNQISAAEQALTAAQTIGDADPNLEAAVQRVELARDAIRVEEGAKVNAQQAEEIY